MKRLLVIIICSVLFFAGCKDKNAELETESKVLSNDDLNNLFDKYKEEETDALPDEFEVAPKKVFVASTVLEGTREAKDYLNLQLIYNTLNYCLKSSEEVQEEIDKNGKLCVELNDLLSMDTEYDALEKQFNQEIDDYGEDFELQADCNAGGKITVVVYENHEVRVMVLNEDNKIVTGHAYKDENNDYIVMDVNYKTEERKAEHSDLETLDYVYRCMIRTLEETDIQDEVEVLLGENKTVTVSLDELFDSDFSCDELHEFVSDNLRNEPYLFAKCNIGKEIMVEISDELGIKVFVSDDGDIVKCSYLFDENGNPREMMLDDVLE